MYGAFCNVRLPASITQALNEFGVRFSIHEEVASWVLGISPSMSFIQLTEICTLISALGYQILLWVTTLTQYNPWHTESATNCVRPWSNVCSKIN